MLSYAFNTLHYFLGIPYFFILKLFIIYSGKNRYKVNTIVDDGSGIANFTIFGRLAQELIRVPAQNLVIAINSDKFTLPSMIKTIINQKHIFQITPDTQKFRTNIPSFKVQKIFTMNNDPKGKE